MHLVRVLLPDRPGSLGTVAGAIGLSGADIQAMEVVERRDGQVVDDFMVTLLPGALAETLVGAVAEVPGARVLWISRHPDSWGLEGDVEVLDRMMADRDHALEILTEASPVVFHCQWALLLDRADGRALLASHLAPDLGQEAARLLGDLTEPHTVDLAAGWLPMWGDTLALVCPAPGGRTVVLGRLGGPEFLDSELRRLEHLVALS